MWQAIAAIGAQGASSGYSWWLGREAASQQRADTREQLRRFRLEHQQVLGEARARGAASGIEFESQGLQTYLQTMEAEFARQEQWAYDAGMREAKGMERQAWWNLATGGAQMFQSYAQSQNWWRDDAETSGGSES
jgi:hypothetical protein